MQHAVRYASHAVDIASGLNIAAFNLRIALGAWGGGLIADQWGLQHAPWIGNQIVVIAILLTRWSGHLDYANPLSLGLPVNVAVNSH